MRLPWADEVLFGDVGGDICVYLDAVTLFMLAMTCKVAKNIISLKAIAKARGPRPSDVIKRLCRYNYSLQDLAQDEEENCELGIELGNQGDLEMAKYFSAQKLHYLDLFLDCCLYGAVCAGHVPVVEWLLKVRLVSPDSFEGEGDYEIYGNDSLLDLCDSAAANGRLNLLEWLRAQDPPYIWSERTCLAAAAHGKIDVLIWLRRQDPPCPWDHTACTTAAMRYARNEFDNVQRSMASLTTGRLI